MDSSELASKWKAELIGKQIVSKDGQAAVYLFPSYHTTSLIQCMPVIQAFAETELPNPRRILTPNQPMTLDFRPDRRVVFE
jgi:hypothetical protein